MHALADTSIPADRLKVRPDALYELHVAQDLERLKCSLETARATPGTAAQPLEQVRLQHLGNGEDDLPMGHRAVAAHKGHSPIKRATARNATLTGLALESEPVAPRL